MKINDENPISPSQMADVGEYVEYEEQPWLVVGLNREAQLVELLGTTVQVGTGYIVNIYVELEYQNGHWVKIAEDILDRIGCVKGDATNT